jgi:hypothetical protein
MIVVSANVPIYAVLFGKFFFATKGMQLYAVIRHNLKMIFRSVHMRAVQGTTFSITPCRDMLTTGIQRRYGNHLQYFLIFCSSAIHFTLYYKKVHICRQFLSCLVRMCSTSARCERDLNLHQWLSLFRLRPPPVHPAYGSRSGSFFCAITVKSLKFLLTKRPCSPDAKFIW